MKEKIIQTGAEAILIRKKNIILKRRVSKGYRFPNLDKKLRKSRTISEAKLLKKAFKLGAAVPMVERVDNLKMEIEMNFISGLKLSENLDKMENWKEVCKKIGEGIAKLHSSGIIHGDLTTSNMIWNEKEKRLYFIDFGLGFHSNNTEDKAVDLHLIKQALEAKHFKKWQTYLKIIIKGYKKYHLQHNEVLKRLEKVEKRGRYKKQY